MKIFVTGGTGFIGSHLAEALLRQDASAEVRCLVRGELKWLEGKPVTPVKGDLNDIEALRSGMEGADVVFHLAALVKAPRQEVLNHVNVEGSENLLRAAHKARVPKVVMLSSLAAAGPSSSRPLTEEDPLRPISMYGISKKLMEEMVHRTATEGDSITLLRPPAVFGPREEQILSFFQMASRGICPIVGGNGQTRISMVHVDDVVQGLLLAAGQLKKGVHTYFVSSEQVYTWNEIKAATAEALQRRLLTLPLPPKLVHLAGGVIETAGGIFGAYPDLNRDKAREMTQQWTCSVNKIKKELGFWQTRSLQNGISHTIRWYKKHNWI